MSEPKPGYLENKCYKCHFGQEKLNNHELVIRCHRKLLIHPPGVMPRLEFSGYYPIVAIYNQDENDTFKVVRELGTCSKFKDTYTFEQSSVIDKLEDHLTNKGNKNV